MSILRTETSKTFFGNSSARSFTVDNVDIIDSSQVKVKIYNITGYDKYTYELTLNTHFTVNIVADTFDVILDSAIETPVTGERIVIYRQTNPVIEESVEIGGSSIGGSFKRQIERNLHLNQEVKEDIKGTVRVRKGDVNGVVDLEIPFSDDRKDKFLGFDGSGKLIAKLGSIQTEIDDSKTTSTSNTYSITKLKTTFIPLIITTEGDIIIGDVNGKEERLTIGNLNQILISDGVKPAWINQQIGYKNTILTEWISGTQVKIKSGSANSDDYNSYINLLSDVIIDITVSGLGGLANTVNLTPNTTYHVFVISKADGTISVGFDTDLSASNLLASGVNYVNFKRVLSIITDVNSNIIGFNQNGNKFTYNLPILDYNTSASNVTFATTVPLGISVEGIYRGSILHGGHGTAYGLPAYLTSVNDTSGAPTFQNCNIISSYNQGASTGDAFPDIRITTNASGQIRFRGSVAFILAVSTVGYIDNLID